MAEELEARAAELDERERVLAARVTAVTARERELVARAGEAARRERELAGRERELDARIAELDGRERELDARIAEVDGRERELDARDREGVERGAAVAAREAELDRMRRDAEAAAARDEHWTLDELEARVRSAQANGHPQADEWEAYLFSLRSYAAADGRVPAELSPFVASIFGDRTSR